MLSDNVYTKQLIIKPTTACNFDCTFCSAKLLNIPIHEKVPEALKNYLLINKPNLLIIMGGEPLMNPRSYFEDLINIMDSLHIEYEIGLVSNLVLWYNNPEKYDYLFNNPHVTVDTSFQYGDDRRDDLVYTEERFLKIFNLFKERYNKKLLFLYVVNKNNEKYVQRAFDLANKLQTGVKFNNQLAVGKSLEYYPRYKIFQLYLDLIKNHGLLEKNPDLLENIRKHQCSYTLSHKYCQCNRAVYVNDKEELVEGNCEEELNSEGKLKIGKGMLFKKCLLCPLFPLCNECSVNRISTEEIKDEHCKWMKEHYNELKKYGFI